MNVRASERTSNLEASSHEREKRSYTLLTWDDCRQMCVRSPAFLTSFLSVRQSFLIQDSLHALLFSFCSCHRCSWESFLSRPTVSEMKSSISRINVERLFCSWIRVKVPFLMTVNDSLGLVLEEGKTFSRSQEDAWSNCIVEAFVEFCCNCRVTITWMTRRQMSFRVSNSFGKVLGIEYRWTIFSEKFRDNIYSLVILFISNWTSSSTCASERKSLSCIESMKCTHDCFHLWNSFLLLFAFPETIVTG